LNATAEDLDAAGRDNKTGYGLVKAQAAVNYLAGTTCGGGTVDNAPNASFSDNCTELSCSFDASGSTDDNGISNYSWNFGDGNTASGVTANHNYAADGTYTVTLTVTDTANQTDTSSRSVTVSSASSNNLQLSASGYKRKGRHNIDLSWSGATGSNVDIYRNGSLLTATANDGAYTDATGNRGGATYIYKVCEAGTSNCSAEVTVVF
ncbi:MAG: PKD domain-containing protein, partial [Kangiellaceae bacterium]|nr:PKD domain-containing protein [Kangiellaceae bacterium]